MDTVNKILSDIVGGDAPATQAIVRRAAYTPEIRGIEDKTRCITFAASTESEDRYGDIIRADGWETTNYERNPVFLFGHRSDEPPIGKCVKLWIEKGANPALVQTIQFADKETYPFADTIFQLYKGGFMKAVSVGFRPLEQPKRIVDAKGNSTGGLEFTKQELYELSAVPIPANPEALARAFDSGIITRADAGRVFIEDENSHVPLEDRDDDKRTLDFAREVLAMSAAKLGKVPLDLPDELALATARFLTAMAAIDRSLAGVQQLVWVLPTDALVECDSIVSGMVREWDEHDFFRKLTSPEPATVEAFLESLVE